MIVKFIAHNDEDINYIKSFTQFADEDERFKVLYEDADSLIMEMPEDALDIAPPYTEE